MQTSRTPVMTRTETSDREIAPQAASFSNVVNLIFPFATPLPVADNATAFGYAVHVTLCSRQAAT